MNRFGTLRLKSKEKASQLKSMEAIASKSKLSESDALELGRKIKKSIWEKRYKRLS